MTKSEPVPFLDLQASHRDLESELLQVVQQALRSTAFIGGARGRRIRALLRRLL